MDLNEEKEEKRTFLFFNWKMDFMYQKSNATPIVYEKSQV